MATTIKDIAEKAGVSYQTVSHALRSTGRVGKKTASKIRRVAEKMEYIPDGIARSLRTKSTKTLGIILPCIYDNEFYAGVYRGIEDSLVQAGYNLILCNSDFDVEREAKYLKMLQEKRMDGIVLAPALGGLHTYENAKLIKNIMKRIPVILVDRYVKDIETDYIGFDNVGGAYEAVEHLIKLGHTRIGCIVGPRVSTALERFRGYQKALEQYDIAFNKELVRWFKHPIKYEHSTNNTEGYHCAKELLKSNPPTAIFVVNDVQAIAVMKAITEEGLNVPEDIAVVGYDDMRVSSHLAVPLTTVRQDLRRMGETVSQVFLERVGEKKAKGVKKVIMPVHLVVRSSCGAHLSRKLKRNRNKVKLEG